MQGNGTSSNIHGKHWVGADVHDQQSSASLSPVAPDSESLIIKPISEKLFISIYTWNHQSTIGSLHANHTTSYMMSVVGCPSAHWVPIGSAACCLVPPKTPAALSRIIHVGVLCSTLHRGTEDLF